MYSVLVREQWQEVCSFSHEELPVFFVFVFGESIRLCATKFSIYIRKEWQVHRRYILLSHCAISMLFFRYPRYNPEIPVEWRNYFQSDLEWIRRASLRSGNEVGRTPPKPHLLLYAGHLFLFSLEKQLSLRKFCLIYHSHKCKGLLFCSHFLGFRHWKSLICYKHEITEPSEYLAEKQDPVKRVKLIIYY